MATSELLSGLPLKGLIRTHFEWESLKQLIVDKLRHIPEIDKLKSTVQLVQLVCELVENCVAPKNSKAKKPVDKKALVIEIMDKLFELNDLEKAIIARHIEYLCDSKAIKRLTRWSRCKKYLRSFFCFHQDQVFLHAMPLGSPSSQ